MYVLIGDRAIRKEDRLTIYTSLGGVFEIKLSRLTNVDLKIIPVQADATLIRQSSRLWMIFY